MGVKRLFLKITGIIAAVVLGAVLLLLIAITVVLATPGARTAVLQKCVTEARERTGLDVDLGRLHLSPFHHSPMVLYRAWKGEGDLPLDIEIDSLYIGHRGQDTLIYVHALRLHACMEKAGSEAERADLTARTIEVEQLLLDRATVHSDSLMDALGLDLVLGQMHVKSPGLNIAKGQYPLHGLKLADAYIGVTLRDTPSDAQDTTSTPMAFDVPDGELHNVRFVLNPTGLDIRAGSLSADILADVGGNRYDARHLEMGNASLAIGTLNLPFDTVRGDALVDLNTGQIQSKRLYARAGSLGAEADLRATMLNLETMQADLTGRADYRDDKARVSGEFHAKGQGLDPRSPDMQYKLDMHLSDCSYDRMDVSGLRLDAFLANGTLTGNMHLPVSMAEGDLRLKAETEHLFRVSDFLTPERMGVDYHAQMKDVKARAAGEDFDIDRLDLDFTTDTATSLHVATRGLTLDAQSPMHVLRLADALQPLPGFVADTNFVRSVTSLQDLTVLDTLRRLLPDLRADILLTKGSPFQAMIGRMGLDIREMALSLNSDTHRSDLALDVSVPEIVPPDSTGMRIPAATATMRVSMTEGRTTASLTAGSHITDGVMNVSALSTDAAMQLDLERDGRELNGTGQLVLDSLRYNAMDFGKRTAGIRITPSVQYEHALRADVRLDDIPLELVNGIIDADDIDLEGVVRMQATADGLPAKRDLSAVLLPLGAGARYKPYDVSLRLGETPVVMENNHVKLDDLRIYSADSSYLALNGGVNLNTMLLDINLAADRFSPVRLSPEGAFPVYGELATNIRGRVSGPLDNILADVSVTVLPVTDITYPIDQKNLAQVKPHGTVKLRYGTADGELDLGGILHVDDGLVRYSPKMYPMMPFRVDSTSSIRFNGPLGRTMLDVSASQQVKADVQSQDEETRRVVFNTGVRVRGMLDSLGLNAIGFFLEAPEDETVSRELSTMDEETREGIAATLLATGMYMGKSNVAAQRDGYALSSIINSRINAAMANSRMGNIIDVDISSGQTQHASGKTNDMNIAISKSLFKDKLRITVGSVISDNPEVNKVNGLFNRISADYKLTPTGNVFLRLFSQRDYDNIFEGEFRKSGAGVGFTRQWKRTQRTFDLTADADITYRSNKSLGPNLTLAHSIRNVLGHNETFTVKGFGAYYWSLRDRHPGDPQKTDTYKFGVDAALSFPYLHWGGGNHPDGDTRYRIGYKYENIAGGYGAHKFSGSLSYFIHPSSHVTHSFTPFSLSVVRMNVESSDLAGRASEHPEIIKLLAGNEFIPSAGYGFTYNDYRSRRPVNTMFDFEIKESGNLINAVYCLFNHKWSEPDKTIFHVPYNQFVRLTAELWNKFNLTERVCTATRLFAGANIPLGNSAFAPLSEAFYAGGPNSLRAAEPYAYGAGNFHSSRFNQDFFHAGDVKLEANFELRFPIVWKLNGAVFLDAGNVWNWNHTSDILSKEDYEAFVKAMGLTETLRDGIIANPDFAKQITLGTGAGLRLDIDQLVIRLDLGIGIHAPYQTYRYAKDGTVDLSRPITSYYNMPSAFDGLRLNFGIGYPF